MPGSARKFTVGSVLRAASLIATILTSVLIMPFVVHRLGDRSYGIWTLAATFVGYYGLLDLGLTSAVSRYLSAALGAGNEEECNRILNTSLLLYCLLGFAVMAVGSGLALFSSVWARTPEDASVFWKLIVITSATVALSFPTRVFIGALNAHLRLDRTAGVEIFTLILRTVLTVLVLLAGYRVIALAWAGFFSSLPAIALYVYFSFKELPFLRITSSYFTRGMARNLFSYSIYSLIAQVADILRFQVDALVVAGFVGLAAVTHYKIAGTMAQYFISLMLAIMGGLTFVFSRQEGVRDYRAIEKTFFFGSKIAICIASFIGFGLIVWGKPFITRWMGPQYVDAYPCLVALALFCTVALWQTPSVSLLYGISKHRFFALFNSLEGAANLLISILLARHFGILGVALGTMIPGLAIKLLVQPAYVCHVSGIGYTAYLRHTGRILLVVAMALVVPAIITAKIAGPDYKLLFGVALLSLSAYAIPVWLFVFNAAERQTFKRVLLPRVVAETAAP